MVTDPGDPFGTYYAEILRAEGLNEFAVTDTADLNAATLADYQVVVLAQTAVTDAQTTVLTQLGAGRRQPHRHAARRAPCRRCSAWATPTGTVSNGYIKVNTASSAGAGITADTMQIHGAADRDAGDRRDDRRDALLERHRQHLAPRGDPAQRGLGRRSGRGLHLRPGPLDRGHPPGQPRVGRPEARRPDRPDSLRRPLLPGLAGLQQGADPAGRRAAAPAGQPHHADEPRPHAAAALLVPAARREGRGRPDRRRSRPRRHHRAVQPLPSRRARPAARSPTGNACGRPRTSIPVRTSPTPRRRPSRPPASRSRCT